MAFRETILVYAFRLLGLLTISSLIMWQPAELRAQTPVPLVSQPLVPASVAPGGTDFKLTVNGTGFMSGATVEWNGSALDTVFRTNSILIATVPGSYIASPKTTSVSVKNPGKIPSSNTVFFPVTPATPSLTIENAPGSPIAGIGGLVAVGDFNGDGKLDFVAASGNAVTIQLGNGDGTFVASPSIALASGEFARTIAVGDFDGDGKLDLAIGTEPNYDDQPAPAVKIFLGKGDGTFRQASILLTQAPASIGLGDFNRDGNLDLAVKYEDDANGLAAGLEIFWGIGDGTFREGASPAGPFGAGYAPTVAVGDLNGDGYLDLVISDFNNYDEVIYLGYGDGTFARGVPTSASWAHTTSVSIADLNGDGNLDLAASGYAIAAGGITALLGDGHGMFVATNSTNPSGFFPSSLSLADFNGDGLLDLAVANQSDEGEQTSALLGRGDGTFNPSLPFLDGVSIGYSAESIALGDFNGDGRIDILVANDNSTSVLLQTLGTSLVPTAITFPTQLVGTAGSSMPVTVTNYATLPLSISNISISGANKGDFAIAASGTTCGLNISVAANGGACAIYITFTPLASGARTAALMVSDSAHNSQRTTTLVGEGTAAPTLSLSSDAITFPDQPITTVSQPKSVDIMNTGSTSLVFSAITIQGPNSNDYGKVLDSCSDEIIAPGGACTISMIFIPAGLGARLASLLFVDNASGSPQTVTLTGIGTAPLVLNSSALTFPSQTINTTSDAQSLTATNTGLAYLTVTATIGGTNVGDFVKRADSCTGATVLPKAACTVSMEFTPLASGNRIASLSITDSASRSPRIVSLAGVGTPPPGNPVLTVSTNSLTFGDVLLQGTPLPRESPNTFRTLPIGLTNTGTAALIFSSNAFTFSGAGPGDFAIDFSQPHACSNNTKVAPSSSCTLYVVFTPTATAIRSAILTVSSNASGLQSIKVTGIGMPYFSQCGGTAQDSTPVPQEFDGGASTCKYGCVLSSGAMVLATFPDYSTETPNSLNALAKSESNGLFSYDSEDGMNDLLALTDLPHWVLDPNLNTASLGDYSYVSQYLQQHMIGQQQQVILHLHMTGARVSVSGKCSAGDHYVAVVGKLGSNDWQLADPGWVATSPTAALFSLYDHLVSGFEVSNGTTTCRHTFTVTNILDYGNPPSIASLEVKALSPVELLITDAQGQQTGNVSNGVDVFAIPNSSYFRDYPVADDTGTGPAIGDPDGLKTAFISDPSSSPYTVTATGTNSGSYTLAVRGVANDGSVQEATASGIASVGSSSRFRVAYSSSPGTSVTITPFEAPTVTVTPSSSSVSTAQPLTVMVTVTAGTGNPAPTGLVSLTGGGYTSAATMLDGGSAAIDIAAGLLSAGSDSLTVTYTPDLSSSSIYDTARGTALVMVTVPQKTTPTVTVTPSQSSITTAQPLSVTVAVSSGSGNPSPTGAVTLTSGNYTSIPTTLASGSGTISIPAGSLNTGTDTLTVSYTPDTSSSSIYNGATGISSVTVATAVSPAFTISGTAVTLAPGATTGNTSTITVAPAGGFTGSVTLTAAVTSSPNGAQYPPTLSFGSTSPVSITGTTAGTATLIIFTTAPTRAALVYPIRKGAHWDAAGGTTLACILLFGIRVRRRSWRGMLGMFALFVALVGGVLACGGGGGRGTGKPGTTTGTYTVTVTGTSGSLTQTGTVTVTAN